MIKHDTLEFMKKILIIIFIIILVVFGITLAIYLFSSKKNTAKIEQKEVKTTQTSITPIVLSSWDDPAGFTLSYPSVLSVNKHDEDNQNYAHVELTESSGSGSVIIWAKDLPVYKNTAISTLDDWITNDVRLQNVNVLDTTLGGQPAKKISISSEKTLITAVIYDDLLFYIEAQLPDSKWQNYHNEIIKSFTFKPLNSAIGETGQNSGSGEETEYVDEEETVE